MFDYHAPLTDIEFLLFDLYQVDKDWSRWDVGYDNETARGILTEAGRIANGVMAPLTASADQEGAHWQDGEVTAPQGFKAAAQELQAGGWLGLAGNTQYGGLGSPRVIANCVDEMFWAANTNLWLYCSLTPGASYCINQHANDDLKRTYLPNMYSGQSTGAMALTESHAGTDLGMLRTSATPQDDGSYSISGTKIFITSGEHDLSENIIHLVLARIKGAPQGTRGISLFLVPKFLLDDNGKPGQRNGFRSASIESKMGIHGNATSVINYDDATGYLIGETETGLRNMFSMMNVARLGVGTQGLGLAERAYQMAHQYTHERIQGRAPKGPVDSELPADPIISHPDVRRMMLTQRALNEGGRAFALMVGQFLDRSDYEQDPETSKLYKGFIELLTPVTKAFLTDRGMECCLTAQQCFGGHGYIRDTGIEQVVRDVRISQIYEGTNGIQALDYVGRKVLQDGARSLQSFIDHLRSMDSHPNFAEQVEGLMTEWLELVGWIAAAARTDPELPGAIAVDFLDYSGYVIYASLWALMATRSDTKWHIAQFYFDKILPRTKGLVCQIRTGTKSLQVKT